jgi:hypothetical protein
MEHRVSSPPDWPRAAESSGATLEQHRMLCVAQTRVLRTERRPEARSGGVARGGKRDRSIKRFGTHGPFVARTLLFNSRCISTTCSMCTPLLQCMLHTTCKVWDGRQCKRFEQQARVAYGARGATSYAQLQPFDKTWFRRPSTGITNKL